MAESNKPIPVPFLGLDLSGNPTARPYGTASVCDNLRVMPGGWIRLRGGQKARIAAGHQDIIQFMPSKVDSKTGNSQHLYHYENSASHDVGVINLSNWTTALIEFGGPNISAGAMIPYAIANEWVVYGNGYGVHSNAFASALNSVPSLSYWKPGATARFFGLYPAYDFNIATISSTLSGTGPFNNIPSPGIYVWVGLYNTVTQHYSNAQIRLGRITANGTSQRVVIQGLNCILAPYHSTAERDEIKIVFYATEVGGTVAHLILNAAGTGPYTVDLGTASASLHVSSTRAIGFLVDGTKERPINNYPPRQMRSMCFANGRLFGILRPEGVSATKDALWGTPGIYDENDQITWPPFEYEIKTTDLSGVVWSMAQGDLRAEFVAGDPLQCWPAVNFSPTPSGERPVSVFAAPNDIDAVVWTATRTYLLREQADGLMEWTAIADFGMKPTNVRTPSRSQYGVLWVNNFNQICLLDNQLRVRVLSGKYDAVLRDELVLSAAYFKDPLNSIDRYQVFYGLNKALIHDFATGSAYTETRTPVKAAAQVADGNGREYMLIASGVTRNSTPGGTGYDVTSIEAQPDLSYRIPATDENYDNTGTVKVSSVIADGTLEFNWTDYGDPDAFKEVYEIVSLGDGERSATLGENPLSGEVFRDYEPVTAGAGAKIDFEPVPQKASIRAYLGKMKQVLRFAAAWKFRLTIKAHASDTDGYYINPSQDGSLASNFYASIMKLMIRIGNTNNRG